MERILSDLSEILSFKQQQLLCSSLGFFASDVTRKKSDERKSCREQK